MPFWWQRRKRWWWRGRQRAYYKRKYPKRRKRRRVYRRKRRRAPRRRYRRRTKVRRKKKQIPIRQWQPAHIRKCKIKGLAINCLGGDGKQFVCYTDDQYSWTPPRAPGGGGFGHEKYTLQYLYKEFKKGHNIWTSSNAMLDLVRYTGCKFIFWRHPKIDFLVTYNLSYPMIIDKYSYSDCHPFKLLLAKHKRLIPSKITKPLGKPYVKIKIRPPRQMITKWFFQEGFANTGLVEITSAACDMNYANLGRTSTNQLVSFVTLNNQFYTKNGWGNKSLGAYMPSPTETKHFPDAILWNGKKKNITVTASDYNTSVAYETGWFQPDLLQVKSFSETQQVIPTNAGRYNPTIDDGTGNSIWLVSVLNSSFAKPTSDKTLIIEGKPIWQLLYGFANFVQKYKKDPTFLKTYLLVIESPYIFPYHEVGTLNFHIPIDQSFINGKGPYDDYVTTEQKKLWFPTLQHQQQTINAFVESGPFIPKLNNERDSTWELRSLYTFYFKFGGAQLPETEALDPSKQADYEVPDTLKSTLQIINPEKQAAASILHTWDFRRGIVKKSALKRMLEDQETDTDFQTDADSPTKKKKKTHITNQTPCYQEEEEEIHQCLLSLCEEPTCQDFQEVPENQQLLQLIQQQQQQQQQIKLQLLQLIASLKQKQKMLQLQTGMLD
nr:MAG: ORF1 [Torque teno midi virus]